ncbi:MAG: hypothetical protein AAF283_01865 [Cyanobacteria bacterium P01_A01_bin.70]
MTVFTVTADTIFAITPRLNPDIERVMAPAIGRRRSPDPQLFPQTIHHCFCREDGNWCGRSRLVSVTTIIVIK